MFPNFAAWSNNTYRQGRKRECVPQPLHDSITSGMKGHVDVQNAPAIIFIANKQNTMRTETVAQ
jgi:hypothetical protein